MNNPGYVIPAKAGIQKLPFYRKLAFLDARRGGHDINFY
jgi:hypothetical protein